VNVSIGDSRRAFAAFGRCNALTPAVIGRQHTVVTSEIDPRFWHEDRQSRNEMHGVEGHLRGAIPVGRFQGLANLAGGTQQKAGNGHRWSGNVPTQSLTLVLLMSFTAHPGV
jgi:hypothetical protein